MTAPLGSVEIVTTASVDSAVAGVAGQSNSALRAALSGFFLPRAEYTAGGTAATTVSAADLTAAKARANHTGSQTSATISDFTEAVQDAVGLLLGAGSNVILNYDDAANKLSISSTGTGGTGLDAEQVRDAIGVALVGVGNIAVVVNDAADTITFSTTATVNSTDAQLRDRATHTGVQTISTVSNLQASLDSKAPLASPTFTGTVAGVTKAHVGLGNVSNTADADKPVSNPQATAINAKVTANGITEIRAITQAAYDALTTKVATTLYVITD